MSPSTPQLGSYPASFSLSSMDTRRLPFNKFLRRSNQHLWTVYQQHSGQVNSKLCFLASDQRTCNASMSHSHCSKPMLIQLCADIGLCHDLSTTENKLLSPVLCHVTLHTYAILMSQELSDLHFFFLHHLHLYLHISGVCHLDFVWPCTAALPLDFCCSWLKFGLANPSGLQPLSPGLELVMAPLLPDWNDHSAMLSTGYLISLSTKCQSRIEIKFCKSRSTIGAHLFEHVEGVWATEMFGKDRLLSIQHPAKFLWI